MPRGAPAAEKPEDQTPEPEEQSPPQAARRPRQTQQTSQEGRVIEGKVPVLELYQPEPIKPEALAKLNVYQRWNAMIGEMGIIPKRGWNDHHKYWFTTDADLNAFIGPLLSKYHLLVIPSVDIEHVERFETAGKQFVTRVPMLIRIVNADNPEDLFEVPWMGEGGDTVDKGLYKSYTGGLKYFYMKTLQVATGDDPETFARTDEIADMAARSQATAPQQQSRPVQITSSTVPQPAKGGHQEEGTNVQIRTIKAYSRALEYGSRGTAEIFDRVLGTSIFDTIDSMDSEDEQNHILTDWMKKRSGEELGQIVTAMSEEIAARTAQKEVATANETTAEEPASNDGA